MNTDLVSGVADAWGWTSMKPQSVLAQNACDNSFLMGIAGRHWRICSEDLACSRLADAAGPYRALWQTPKLMDGWFVASLVRVERDARGEPMTGRCLHQEISRSFGGLFERKNIATISAAELIGASGDMAEQVEDLPDGAKVRRRAGKLPDPGKSQTRGSR